MPPPETEVADVAGPAEVKRRGRKRGKHNFEPGYKDQLFDDWTAFTQKHRRCPRIEEVKELSEVAFEKRRSALKSEDPNHPHLSILEAPLDPVQVKNLVNNEKRRRSKLVSHYPSVDDDGDDGTAQEDKAGAGRDHWASRSIGEKASKAATGFAPVSKKRKKEKQGYSMAESEADSHSTFAAAAGLAGLDAVADIQRAVLGSEGNPAGSASGGASGSPPDHILSAALSACQQVLQAQQASPGSGLDLQLLQESLKHALAAQLQQMSPAQQLALWQIQQQQQSPLQQYGLSQQPALQQAITTALTQQPSLAQALLQLPGMHGSVMQNSLLSSLASSLGQQPGQLQSLFGGLSLPGYSGSQPSSSLASAMTSGPSVQPQKKQSTQRPQQPSLAQVMQVMQLFQGQQ
ncbi:uncharacterized protein LOC142357223 [Convolutriloba macropyga]|uniref:uncharacterized protein LOC142357223 n=1 Tax=Convolutriloba macropyga TaxID=536237 RepID=UPI003F52592C